MLYEKFWYWYFDCNYVVVFGGVYGGLEFIVLCVGICVRFAGWFWCCYLLYVIVFVLYMKKFVYIVGFFIY